MSVRVGDEIVAGGQGDMYTKAQVDALIASAIAQTTEKPGMIKPFAGTTVPTGYLLCDGSAVSRTTYANLFAAIGTTYGSGDGSTTFNLPSLDRRVISGAGSDAVGSTSDGSLPAITGSLSASTTCFDGDAATVSGAITLVKSSARQKSWTSSYNTAGNGFTVDASRCSSSYWRTDNQVHARNVKMYYIIKY